jgi:hypothetical protein
MTSRSLARFAIAPLVVNHVTVGAWATFAPRSFFDDFPLGRGWVASLAPYNEHLVRDVGGLSLGFAVLFVALLVNPSPTLARPALYAWLVTATAHFAFHLDHLQGFSGPDAAAQTLGLACAVLLPAAVLWMVHGEETYLVQVGRANRAAHGTQPSCWGCPISRSAPALEVHTDSHGR